MNEDGVDLVHYYGDIVRRLFVAAAVVMIITLPFFTDRLPISVNLSVILIVLIGLFAGLTNPRQKWVALSNTVISVFGLVFFEYYAVVAYLNYSVGDAWFWANEILALIFFFALYFSTKTLRGKFLRRS